MYAPTGKVAMTQIIQSVHALKWMVSKHVDLPQLVQTQWITLANASIATLTHAGSSQHAKILTIQLVNARIYMTLKRHANSILRVSVLEMTIANVRTFGTSQLAKSKIAGILQIEHVSALALTLMIFQPVILASTNRHVSTTTTMTSATVMTYTTIALATLLLTAPTQVSVYAPSAIIQLTSILVSYLQLVWTQ
jgi:hypothetical protein